MKNYKKHCEILPGLCLYIESFMNVWSTASFNLMVSSSSELSEDIFYRDLWALLPIRALI